MRIARVALVLSILLVSTALQISLPVTAPTSVGGSGGIGAQSGGPGPYADELTIWDWFDVVWTHVGTQSSSFIDGPCYTYDGTGLTEFFKQTPEGQVYHVVDVIPGWYEDPNVLHFDLWGHNHNIEILSTIHIELWYTESSPEVKITDVVLSSNEVIYAYTVGDGNYRYVVYPDFLVSNLWNLQWRSWKATDCGGGIGGSPPCAPKYLGGRVPNLAVWDGAAWVIENTILPQSGDNPGSLASDSFRFSTPVTPKDDRYNLWVSQLGYAKTTLERVRLRTVDAPVGVAVALDFQGSAHTYASLSAPDSASTNLGGDVTANVAAADGNGSQNWTFAYVAAGGYVEASFSFTPPGSSIPKLFLRAEVWNDSSAKVSATVLASLGGQWQEIGKFSMRRSWYLETLNLSGVLEASSQALMVRIVFTQPVRVDQVAYESSYATNTEVSYVSLLSAYKPVAGNVTSNLTAIDGLKVNLVSGEYVSLDFAIPSQLPNRTRWTALEVDGYYILYPCP